MSTVEQQIRDAIQEAIAENEVILFMKGTPEAPRCGFSARTVAALEALGAQFAAVDILPDPRIRQELSGLSNWPTIPQLFVRGELVGGCDIVTEMYETGELAEVLRVAPPASAPDEAPAASEAGAPGSAPVGGEAPPLTIENRLN
jgi:monothiol glutaredoxin